MGFGLLWEQQVFTTSFIYIWKKRPAHDLWSKAKQKEGEKSSELINTVILARPIFFSSLEGRLALIQAPGLGAHWPKI